MVRLLTRGFMLTNRELQNILDQINSLFSGVRDDLEKLKKEVEELKEKKLSANKKS
jgi:hypothetical protein